MNFFKKIGATLNEFTGNGQQVRLYAENEEMRVRERNAINYVRSKVNQLLLVMGTLPLRHEELDDKTLLDLDPIGIVADSFTQVLDHLNNTNERLKHAREEIQAILTTAGVGILVVDDKMRIQAYNPKLKELFFKDKTEVIGQSCCGILCGTEIPPAGCTFEKIRASHIGFHNTDWEHNGRQFDVAGSPIKNKFGDITQVVLVYIDISERKLTENALKQSEEMYRNLFDNANDMIQSVAPDGSFLYVNPSWRMVLGYRQDEMASLNLFDVIHPDCQAHCMDLFKQLQSGKPIGRIAAVFVAKDGTPLKVDGNVSCGFKDGAPAATCGIFRRVDPPPA